MTHDIDFSLKYQCFCVMRYIRITLNFKLLFLHKKMAAFLKKQPFKQPN